MRWEYKKLTKDEWKLIQFSAAAVVGFLICFAATYLPFVRAHEYATFDLVYRLAEFLHLPPEVLAPTMFLISGTVSVVCFSLILIGAAAMRKKLAIQLIISTSLAYLLGSVLKLLIAHPRTAVAATSQGVPFDAALYSPQYDVGYGFPSLHATLVTAAALTIMLYVPKKYHVLLWLWVVLVGFSRIYLGMHTLLEVLAGLCVGAVAAVIGQLVIYHTKRLKRH